MDQDPNGPRFRRSRIGLGHEWEGKKETENGGDEKLHKPERVAGSVALVNPFPSLVVSEGAWRGFALSLRCLSYAHAPIAARAWS